MLESCLAPAVVCVCVCAATTATANNGNREHDTLTNLSRILSHWQRSIEPETNETMRKWKTALLLHFIHIILVLRRIYQLLVNYT